TAPAPPPGCGRAAHRALLAGSRRSPRLDAARLGAMEVGRAGRGKVPTRRRTARHRGSWPRPTRRSPNATPRGSATVEVCRAGLCEVRTQGAGEQDGRPVCQWRSKMSHLWRLKMSHSAGGDEPLVRRRLPAASLPPRLIVPHLTAGGLEGLVELGVVAHAVAVAADAHDVAVVEQAVDQRGRHDL